MWNKAGSRYIMYDVKSSFLIKVGLYPVYQMAGKKHQKSLLACNDIVLAPDIETF